MVIRSPCQISQSSLKLVLWFMQEPKRTSDAVPTEMGVIKKDRGVSTSDVAAMAASLKVSILICIGLICGTGISHHGRFGN